jgi:hypothetical protein
VPSLASHDRVSGARATCLLSPDISPHRDPYAKGPRQFSSFVRIDTIPSDEVKARRHATLSGASSPATMDDAIGIAMQYGKDIVDGKVRATEL